MVILLALVVIASGCGADNADSGTSSTDGGSANIVIEVMQGGTVIAGFLLVDLRKLSNVTVKSGGLEQEGLTVRSLLAAAGVEAFETVTVDGFWAGRTAAGGELTLNSAEIDDQVLLVTDRLGEFKLVSPTVPPGQSLIGVRRLTVE